MGPQTWFLRHSKGNFMRNKMRYLLGFVDLICFKIFNIGNLRVDIKHKSGDKWNPRGSPWVRIWHAPSYHIPKHFCYTQRTPILIKYSSFWFLLGVIKLPKYYIGLPIVTMVNIALYLSCPGSAPLDSSASHGAAPLEPSAPWRAAPPKPSAPWGAAPLGLY